MPDSSDIDDAVSVHLKECGSPEEKLLVGVSGGRDSMTLLHALHSGGWQNLIVCHVNHRLRDSASDEDEALVRGTTEKMGFECETTRVDVAAFAKESKQSIEAAARELRYRFFARIGKKFDCHRVALGHHADDQVETVLINFFRGSGSRGLSGMEPVSNRIIDGWEMEMVRPLLSVQRESIDAYLAGHDIPFRDDESNLEDFALRNRIRNRLMPLLGEVFERDVRPSVLRSAELSRRMENWACEMQGPLPEKENGLDVEILRSLSRAHRDRLLLRWLRSSGVPDCGYREVERVCEILLSDTNPAKANLPGAHHVRRKAGVLFLEFPHAKPENPK